MDEELKLSPLMQATTEQLFDELDRRCSGCIVLMFHEGEGGENATHDSMDHHRHGNFYTLLGMIDLYHEVMKTEREGDG